MSDTSKLLIATIGGIALGATAGILLAPQSGKETREDIADKACDLKEKIADALSRGGDLASDSIESMKESLSELEKQIKEKQKEAQKA